MTSRTAFNLVRVATRSGVSRRRAIGALSRARISPISQPTTAILPGSIPLQRLLSTTRTSQKGISPESDNPPPPKQPKETPVTAVAAELTESEYHELADQYLDSLLTKLEDLQENNEGIEVEFSAGVLSVSFPNGTYVINKQPPNKQIWLSSPISGPKRYDWVVLGDGQDAKAGTASGNWIYLRDMSTLNDLVLEELKVDPSMPVSQYGE